MKDPNKVKEISKRKYNFVLGLFLALFSIVLFINYTVFPRIFTYGPVYVFGIGSYLIYIIIYLIGMGLMFNFKLPKAKKWHLILGFTFLVLGALVLVSHIAVSDSTLEIFNISGKAEKYVVEFETSATSKNFADVYNAVFNNFETGKNYLSQENINLFSQTYPVGGGIFGYLLLACGNSLFNGGGIVLATLLFIIAALIFAIPLVKAIVKMAKNNKKENESEEDNLIDIHSSQNVPEEKPVYEDYNPSGYDEPKLSGNSFYLNNYDETENGVFSRPKFTMGDGTPQVENSIPEVQKPSFEGPQVPPSMPAANPAPAPVAQPQIQPQYQQQVVQPQPTVQQQLQPQAPVQPTRHEQLSLDFDQKQPAINESLVVTQPTFQAEPEAAPVIPTQVAQPEPVQVKKERVKWIAPSSDMLSVYPTAQAEEKNNAVAAERQRAINEVFESFKIGAKTEDYIVGSSVTRFNIKYAQNVSSKSVSNIVSDISIRLGGVPARFTPIVEGQTTSGLEVPNAMITTVSFKEVYDGLPDVKKHPLAVAFGKNISGKIIFADYDEFPHLLVAGTTGSGKSIFVNSLIATLIMRNSPDDLKLILVDPKTVEMARYKDMPHLLRPIIYTAEEAYVMGKKLVEEMENRYKLFAETGATNIKEYNADCEAYGTGEKLPYIIFVFDEYADLIDQKKELSQPVVSLAQKARACGIHLLISTQRPSTNVVTGTIKANLPTHVALMTSNTTDSITIIGEGGAEKLLGKGDMLVQSPLVSRVGAVRLQGCFASRDEIVKVIRYLKEHYPTNYDPKFLNLEEEAEEEAEEYKATPEFAASKDGGEEARYQQIKEWVMAQEFMSISRIQRECAVGFNRAGRFFTRMQQEGIVDTKVDGNRGCRVLKQDKFGEDTVVVSSEQSYFRE